MPVIVGWMVQRYAKVPVAVNWKLNVAFGATLLEFHRLVFEIVLWTSESMFVQTTVDPTVVVSVVGENVPPTPAPVIETAVPVPVVG